MSFNYTITDNQAPENL